MTEQQREHQFKIETCAKAIAFLASNEDADLGNREILLALLASEIVEAVHKTLSD